MSRRPATRDLTLLTAGALIAAFFATRPQAVRSQEESELLQRIEALEQQVASLKTETKAEIERVETTLTPMVESLELNVADLMNVSFREIGSDLVLAHNGSEIRITGSGVIARGKSSLRLEADDIDVVAGQTLDASGPVTTLLGSNSAELSGASVRVTAGSKVKLEGPVTQIGNGTRQIARVGDSVVNGKIASGTSQILCP